MAVDSIPAGAPLRIGITGPSGTGKTTLATTLAAECGVAVAPEGAREAAAAVGLTTSKAIDISNALKFQGLVLQNKVEAERGLWPRYVSDRTVIDCAAFWLYRELRGFLPQLEGERDSYFARIESYIRTSPYDIVFFLEPGAVPWLDDGFRVRDDEPMRALILGVINGRFRRALEAVETRVCIVSAALPLVARLDFCLTALSEQKR